MENIQLLNSWIAIQSPTLTAMLFNINYKLLENTDSILTQALLIGNASFNITDNTHILN